MTNPQTILIVDDEPHIREVVRFALRKAGYQTAEAADGEEALRLFRSLEPALVVLDIIMPELEGTDVCREIRRTSETPIVFLSSRDDEVDRIVGLELGGDDYVTKPFSPRELVARVKAVLRRAKPAPSPVPEGERLQRHGSLELDLDRFRVHWDGREVILTVTEFGLLRTLLAYPGKVFTREELINKAYAYDNVVSDRTIDSHVRRIRRKFEAVGGELIETVHGLGYKLGECRLDR